MSHTPPRIRNAKSGLADWMQEVLTQADLAANGFKADPVHDLRVAIRRCRSIAEGLRAIDPDPRWKKMRRSAKEVFASLGRLRDSQVMMEWIGKLVPEDDPAARTMIAYCQAQERSFKKEAEVVLEGFNRKQWQSWAVALPRRAVRFEVGSEPFEALALERWMQARRMHNHALRTGRQTAFHRVRVGVKKFRYVIEHFMPVQHEQWCEGLKHFQDLLGEAQDLTVLWETAVRIGVLDDSEERQLWENWVLRERDARIERYKIETGVDNSPWRVWRSGLPRGQKAKEAALKKLQLWASFLDPDVRHSRRVTRLALQIHHGLERVGLLGIDPRRSRELLLAATSVIGVGGSARGKHRPKLGERMINQTERPVAWKRQDLAIIAAIVRFHRGVLPAKGHASLRRFSPALQRFVQRLIGITRLASALDVTHQGTVRRVTLSNPGNFVVISAEGLDPRSEIAEAAAGARYFLEMSLGVPIFIRPFSTVKRKKAKGLRVARERAMRASV